MRIEQSFEIAAPVERVWAALIDIEFVAPCLPGAAITGREDDGSYKGSFTVKLGPTTAAYNGILRIEDADERSHTATLNARGTDKRGQGGVTASIANQMTAVEGGTRVDAETDLTITGRLARFGRGGMIEDISDRLLRDFASCLQSKLAQQPEAAAPEVGASPGRPTEQAPAKPVKGFSLFFAVLRERIRRLFKRD